METDAESFCCAEADEIYEEMFEGMLLMSHSTMSHSLKIYIPINSVLVLIWLMLLSEYTFYHKSHF